MSDNDNLRIRVTGLPGDMTFDMLHATFRVLLRKVHIKKFTIQDLSNNINGDYKQMTVKVRYRAEAYRAQNFLNSKPLTHNNMKYPIVVQMVEESTDVAIEDLGRQPVVTRERSRSPGHRHESSKFDVRRPNPSREFDRPKDYEPHHRSSKFDERRPHSSREFERCRDNEPHHRIYGLEDVPHRSREKYPPVEKEYRSSHLRNPRPWSRKRYPSDQSRYTAPSSDPLDRQKHAPTQSRYSPPRSRYPPERSRYPPERSKYPPERLKYPPERSKYPPKRSKYTPERSEYPPERSRYPPERSRNSYAPTR